MMPSRTDGFPNFRSESTWNHFVYNSLRVRRFAGPFLLTRKARSGRIYKGLQRCVASYTILRYSIMKYENIVRAVFLNRPNRFIAEVDISGQREIVHVKNTGRCKELLIPGCEVWLTAPGTPGRKTKYDEEGPAAKRWKEPL